MSEHAFIRVFCRHEMKTVCRPSDRNVNWRSPVQGKSHPRGGGGGGVLEGNFGMGDRASILKSIPFIYLAFEKTDPFIYKII